MKRDLFSSYPPIIQSLTPSIHIIASIFSPFLISFLWLKKIILFIYFWLCRVFVALCRLSLGSASRGYSLLPCVSLLLMWLLFCLSIGSRHSGCIRSSAWALQLWCMALVALRPVGSSWKGDWTCVPCIGKQIPIYCTSREVLIHLF